MMKVGILGGGESGVGAALLAQSQGDLPFVSDVNEILKEFKTELVKNNIHFEEGGHSIEILADSDFVVISPGIASNTEIVLKLLDRNIPVISELEYGFRHCGDSKVVAITGSNGKTTTTNLIHHILKTNGLDAVKGGNLGRSFSRLLAERSALWYVLEVSSFQLDHIESFWADHAMILNITPDHLDRYDGQFESYAKSKLRLFENCGNQSTCYYSSSDEMFAESLTSIGEPAERIEINSKNLAASAFEMKSPSLRGDHNLMNASFAIELGVKLGINHEEIQRSLDSFVNDNHRLQTVARINEVEWINDSKATNVDSTYFALKAVPKPIIWIAGGIDKGNDYNLICDLVTEKVKRVVFLGEDDRNLKNAFEKSEIESFEAKDMADAIKWSSLRAVAGDTVLLSPACASFDRFENYEDRGEQFIAAVWNLIR